MAKANTTKETQQDSRPAGKLAITRVNDAHDLCCAVANVLAYLRNHAPFDDDDPAGWGYQAILRDLDSKAAVIMDELSQAADDLRPLGDTADLRQAICTVVAAASYKLDAESFDAFTGYIDALEGDRS